MSGAIAVDYKPPADARSIGHDHFIVMHTFEGEAAGVDVWHKTKAGGWCKGWSDFKGSKWSLSFGPDVGWDLIQLEPLTLAPSLLCRVCGDHGYVREGKWVLA